MLLADPLSRICSPVGVYYDASLPSKFAALLRLLPGAVKTAKNMQTYANKDTIAISRLIQAWRKPTNPIIKSKLVVAGEVRDKISSKDFTFRIGSPFADAGVYLRINVLPKCDNNAILLSPFTYPKSPSLMYRTRDLGHHNVTKM